MRVVVVAVFTVAVAFSRVEAQPALTPPVQPAEAETVSEGTATALAVGTTVAGFAAMYAAADSEIDGIGQIGAILALVGPSAGHIYAGENGHALKMSLLRTAGVTSMLVGLIMMTTVAAASDCIDCRSSNDDQRKGEMLLLAGGVTYAVATAYDLFDAHRAARRTNERAQQRMWMVVPTAVSSSTGAAPALALTGRF